MIAALLLLLQPVAAEGLPDCNEELAEQGIQQEMNICAYCDFLTADAALNEQWALTRAAMQVRDADRYREDDRPGYFETLLEAQRAWITFRDAHCRSEGYRARGGSLEPLLVATCKTALTEARTEELKELARTY